MALDNVEKYGKVRDTLHTLVCEIDYGEALYSSEGIAEIEQLTSKFLTACREYQIAVSDEED